MSNKNHKVNLAPKFHNQTDETRMRRLSKAKTKLVMDHPFFGTIALNMPFILDEQLTPPTAATNGRQVRFHPGFMDCLTDDELLFLVAHEVCHPMFDHCTRRGSRDPVLWNVAADIIVNQLLEDDKIGKRIEGTLLDPGLHAKCNGESEKVYREIEQQQQQQSGSGSGNKGGYGQPGTGNGNGNASIDNMEDADGDPAEMEAEWKVRTAQAAQAARMAGKLSANQERLVGDLLKPKVDWRDILRRFVIKTRDDMRTFSRPNRRFISQGLYMPSRSGEAMGEMVVAIDTSGSIGMEQLTQFATEIYHIQQDCRPKTVHVVYFDSVVCHHDRFDREEDVVVSPHGGGGTAFSPIFRHIDKEGIEPVCCVVLTDLCCSDFGPPPSYPVLWVSTHKGSAPWGEITIMK